MRGKSDNIYRKYEVAGWASRAALPRLVPRPDVEAGEEEVLAGMWCCERAMPTMKQQTTSRASKGACITTRPNGLCTNGKKWLPRSPQMTATGQRSEQAPRGQGRAPSSKGIVGRCCLLRREDVIEAHVVGGPALAALHDHPRGESGEDARRFCRRSAPLPRHSSPSQILTRGDEAQQRRTV